MTGSGSLSAEVELIYLLRRAWAVEGPRPDLHRAAQERLREEWPTLYDAIVALVDLPALR